MTNEIAVKIDSVFGLKRRVSPIFSALHSTVRFSYRALKRGERETRRSRGVEEPGS